VTEHQRPKTWRRGAADHGRVSHRRIKRAGIEQVATSWRQLEQQRLFGGNLPQELHELHPPLVGQIIEQAFVELVEGPAPPASWIAQTHDDVAQPQHDFERNASALEHERQIARDQSKQRASERTRKVGRDIGAVVGTRHRDDGAQAFAPVKTRARRQRCGLGDSEPSVETAG